MAPLFSVITACFNARAALLHTAKSLELQEFRDFEWIVIDGGSSDGTLELLSELPNVAIWLSEPDHGIAEAWNKGIKLCKGNQILFLNAGDSYDKLMLQTFSTHISESHITCCHVRISERNLNSVFRARPDLLWRGMHVPHNWCSVPLSKYKEMGCYMTLKHSMDFEWFARYYHYYGEKGFKVVDSILGIYTLGGHSDVNFAEGFRENERILIELGMSRFKAKALRLAYTLKHFLRYRIL